MVPVGVRVTSPMLALPTLAISAEPRPSNAPFKTSPTSSAVANAVTGPAGPDASPSEGGGGSGGGGSEGSTSSTVAVLAPDPMVPDKTIGAFVSAPSTTAPASVATSP